MTDPSSDAYVCVDGASVDDPAVDIMSVMVFDPQSLGTAEIFEDYTAGLQDLEGFSHLILLYLFHRSTGYSLICRPYMEDEEHGVFAMRAPKRPNPIGLSVVRLLRKEGAVLHLSEMDMLDGTPLLDIKPYVPTFDVREVEGIGWLEKNLDKLATSKDDGRFAGQKNP